MKIAAYVLYADTMFESDNLVGVYSSEAKARSKAMARSEPKSRVWRYRIEKVIVDN